MSRPFIFFHVFMLHNVFRLFILLPTCQVTRPHFNQTMNSALPSYFEEYFENFSRCLNLSFVVVSCSPFRLRTVTLNWNTFSNLWVLSRYLLQSSWKITKL